MEDLKHRRATDELFSPFFAGDSPWWWKAVVQILFWFGPTIVVATVFLGMFTGFVPSPITDNNKILIRLEGKMDNAMAEMRGRVIESKTFYEYLLRLQLQTCRNTSKNEAQYQRCEDYWRK